MAALHGFSLSLALLLCIVASSHCEPVDVALNKPIEANVTCGYLSPEPFLSNRYVYSSSAVRENMTQMCADRTAYPPGAMVDGRDDTWWQSASRRIIIDVLGSSARYDAEIFIDLQQVFEVQSIQLSMGESMRPQQMAIYKSGADGGFDQLVPWLYVVTDLSECNSQFAVPEKLVPDSADAVLCQPYSTAATEIDELVTFNFSSVPESYAAFKNARFVKLEFFNMVLILGINGNNFQHYTVRNLVVMAECTCYGHDVDCVRSNSTGSYECVCGGNTTGRYCDVCLPFYNQQPFRYGVPCEACNCFGHANTCFYDNATASYMPTLNAAGVRSGGGVCIDCQHNTTGNNCEKCMPYHYRPADREQSSLNPCVPCNCSGPHITAGQLDAEYGDCVMNAETAASLPDMNPGDCYCKANVVGPTCDKCKTGFFNLTAENAAGCQDCKCDIGGTTDSSIDCDETGQCQCKKYVTGLRCDACLGGFFGLNANNTDGCLPCQCDVGGSIVADCDQLSGKCACLPGTTGTRCDEPIDGFFYPDLHFMHEEFEDLRVPWNDTVPGYFGFGYVSLAFGQNARAAVQVPSIKLPVQVSSNSPGGAPEFFLLIRYRSSEAVLAIYTIYHLQDPLQYGNVTFQPCSSGWCYTLVSQRPVTSSGTVTVDLSSSQNNIVLLDRAIALPTVFLNASGLFGPEENEQFQATCNVITNDMKEGTADAEFCLEHVFSLTVAYNGGAMPCDCHALGSYTNESCSAYAGQCHCKTGTTGRRCEACDIQHYALTDQGCTPCNCATEHKACNAITGDCLCPPGTQGSQCDQCVPFYYDWDIIRGCQPCGCHELGALTQQCNVTTGECRCHQGVTGRRCDRCLEGYRDMTSAGCLPCGCSSSGATSSICDLITGQCPCKSNTENQWCSACRHHSFTLSASHEHGCLECTCMGITDICTPASFSSVTSPAPVDAYRLPLMVVDESGQPSGLEVTVREPMAEVVVPDSRSVYWREPSLIDKPNQLHLYGATVRWVVQWESDTTDITLSMLNSTNVILIGGSGYTSLRFPVTPTSQTGTSTATLAAELSVENVVAVNGTQGRPTRKVMLLTLADVKFLLLPASFSVQSHISRLGTITYSVLPEDVEQCTCGTAYTGLSCESCNTGFKRANVTTQGFLGHCVPCECHSHSALCDADTGRCTDCQHHTTGDYCEECEVGYYGDAVAGAAADACIQCPCYQPKVVNSTCNVSNDSNVSCLYCNEGYTGPLCDECEPFYYGEPHLQSVGTCQKCFCNGNSDSCNNVTGQCVNCTNDSSGFHCEHCLAGWYGSALAKNCTLCDCGAEWSLSDVCDNVTGQCRCVPGVGGRTCDRCYDNYFNSTRLRGCEPCNCSEVGSVSQQCNETGHCQCKAFTHGSNCDRCATNYWGLPAQPCQACDCDPTGTLVVDNSTDMTCDAVNGQCPCKPGVNGRRCDECQPLHFNFSGNGCTACDSCQSSLYNSSVVLQSLWFDYEQTVYAVADVQREEPHLDEIKSQVDAIHESVGNESTSLYSVSNYLTDQLPRINDSLQVVSTQVNETKIGSSELLSQAADSVDVTHTSESRAASDYHSVSRYVTSVATDVAVVDGYNTSAYLTERSLSVGNNARWNSDATSLFNDQLQQTRVEQQLATDSLSRVQRATDDVTQQVSELEDQKMELARLQSLLANQSASISAAGARLRSTSDRLADVLKIMENTQTTAQSVNDKYTETLTMMEFINAQLNESRVIFATASQQFAATLSDLRTWNASYQMAVQDWTRLVSLSNDVNAELLQLENIARQITNHSQTISSLFAGVQPKGQQAVDAINDYQSIVSLMNTSLQMALVANRTVQDASPFLSSFAELGAAVNQSVAASRALQQTVAQLNSSLAASDISSQLDTIVPEVHNRSAKWSGVYSKLNNLQTQADALKNQFDADWPAAEAELNASNSVVDAALSAANSLTAQTNVVNRSITAASNNITALLNALDSNNEQTKQINDSLRKLTTRVNDVVQPRFDRLKSLDAEVAGSLSQPDLGLNRIASGLEFIYESLAKLDQPVSLGQSGGFIQLNSTASDISRLYNSLGLDLMLSASGTPSRGVLFFADNPTSTEKLLLQVVNSAVWFEFSDVTLTRTVRSLPLQMGRWYRVLATRYGANGWMSIVQLNTGTVSSSSNNVTSTAADVNIKLTSPIYVAGVDRSYADLTKVYEATSFSGCLFNVVYDGVRLPLWQSVLRTDSQAVCCRKPSTVFPPPVSTVSAVTFYGFGYVFYNPQFAGWRGAIKLKFRTFTPNAVVLLLTSIYSGIRDYVGIFLNGGKLQLYILSYDGPVSLESRQVYNTGNWYEVEATYDSTVAQLSVRHVPNNGSDVSPTPVETQTSNAGVTLVSLSVLTLGGIPASLSYIALPVNASSLSGCLNDVQLTPTSSSGYTAVDLTQNINSKENVELDQCYSHVIPGLGMLHPTSYAVLKSVANINTLQFDFISMAPSGLLFYAATVSTVTGDGYLYVSVFNGNVFVLLNQGGSAAVQLLSDGMYLSDARLHSVLLDLSLPTQASMMVDNGRTYSSPVAMAPVATTTNGIQLRDSRLYIGGVPAGVDLQQTVTPVHTSLVGGFSNITVNGRLVDIFHEFAAADVSGVYLSGLPVLRDPTTTVTPPPPVSTTLPPVPPGCFPMPNVTYSDDTNFADFSYQSGSYISYNISGQEALLTNQFELRLNFRALQPDGVILTLLSSEKMASQYLIVYLRRGHIVANMATSSRSSVTRNVTSNYRYDDAYWWQVRVLRINDFLALFIAQRTDYVNNKVTIARTSTLQIGPTVYFGGLPQGVTLPNSVVDLAAVSKSFPGCISYATVTLEDFQTLAFAVARVIERRGVRRCAAQVYRGLSFHGSSGYAVLQDSQYPVPPTYSLVSGFTTNIVFRAATKDALLITALLSRYCFAYLGLVNGQVRAVMSSNDVMSPFVATSVAVPAGSSICNNVTHTVTWSITNDRLIIRVDNNVHEEFPFNGFTPCRDLNVPLYLGGVKEESWRIPGLLDSPTLYGCIYSVIVNGQSINIAESSEIRLAVLGCPVE